jgi:cation diffusion facilitator CzcD-associated flavoprotein CzcO
MINRHLPVAIIGAGPVGLAAAAHLVRRGQAFVVLEAGPAVAGSVRQWGHVRMFTPWRYCVDTAARELLESSAWTHPAMEAIPTGTELVRDYLEPLAALPAMGGHIRLNSRVAAVTRKACDKVRTQGVKSYPSRCVSRRLMGHPAPSRRAP